MHSSAREIADSSICRDVGLGGVRDMGKIPNAVEVFGTPTLDNSLWMALQPTLFKQVKANQSRMLRI